ncbi:MAG TPA: DUF4442 domain-containing protein [Lunatimonas sp.]|nr:DUF4442 domain-containing protein [Lunatimonas sp.]
MTRKIPDMTEPQRKYVRQMRSPFTFRWFLLSKLPTVLFWGARIKHLDGGSCQVMLPYNWRTKNPFRSIYFAALSGAAELASGALCMFYLQGPEKYSMLITGFDAVFLKKADQTIIFTCVEGESVGQLIDSFNHPGQTGSLQLHVSARNEDLEEVANFNVSWSFKRKT